MKMKIIYIFIFLMFFLNFAHSLQISTCQDFNEFYLDKNLYLQNDINSSDIFYQKDTNTRIAKVWSELLFDKNCYWINSAHSGYKDIFGIIHNRKN